MSNPRQWTFEYEGERHDVLLKTRMPSREAVFNESYHWSTDQADECVDPAGGALFAYAPGTNRLRLLAPEGFGNSRVLAECTCPDTWEEALAWMRMACELIHT